MKKRILAGLAILGIVFSILAGCSSAKSNTSNSAQVTANPNNAVGANEANSSKGVRVMRLADVDSRDYALSRASQYFSDEVAKLSNGSIDIQCFFDGVLGEECDTVESLNLGLLEMTRISSGNAAQYVPELALFNLPFIFKDVNHFWSVLNGEVGDIYAELFEKAGLKLITFYDEGARHIFNKTKPIVTPDDLKGLKIRTMGAKSIQQSFTVLGASPTPMNSGEVYTSLSQGLIDACENNYGSIYTLKWYESARYFSNTSHLRVPCVLMCGLKYWNGLSAEEQDIIMKAGEASRVYASDIFDEEEEKAKAAIIAEGCIYRELTSEQINAFAALCEPAYKEFTKDESSKKIFDIIMSLR